MITTNKYSSQKYGKFINDQLSNRKFEWKNETNCIQPNLPSFQWMDYLSIVIRFFMNQSIKASIAGPIQILLLHGWRGKKSTPCFGLGWEFDKRKFRVLIFYSTYISWRQICSNFGWILSSFCTKVHNFLLCVSWLSLIVLFQFLRKFYINEICINEICTKICICYIFL